MYISFEVLWSYPWFGYKYILKLNVLSIYAYESKCFKYRCIGTQILRTNVVVENVPKESNTHIYHCENQMKAIY